MYENLNVTLSIIKWSTLLIIFLKYMFQFKDFAQRAVASSEEMKKYEDSLPVIEKIMGIDNS